MNSTIFALFVFVASLFQTTGLPKEIETALATGNTQVMATYFNSEVDLDIPGSEDIYSKQQAEIILKKFYQSGTPKSYKTLHSGQSKNGSNYAIGNLIIDTTKYRTYILYKTGSKVTIHEIRIEKDSE